MKRTVVLILGVIFLLGSAYADTRARRIKKVRKLDTNQFMDRFANSEATPLRGAIAIVPFGDLGMDVELWESPGNDPIGSPTKIQYQYTPAFYFLREPGTDHAAYALQPWESDEYSIVSLFLVRSNPELLTSLVNKASYYERQLLTIHNIKPMKLLMVEMWPEYESQLPFEIYVRFPDEADGESGAFTGSELLPVNFEVPTEFLGEFTSRIEDGLGFVLRYMRSTVDLGGGVLSQEAHISINSTLNQNMFGTRGPDHTPGNEVWATREQTLAYITSIAEENRSVVRLKDDELTSTFMRLAEKYLDQIQTRSKTLSEMTIDDVLSEYMLKPNDDFMALDFTTMTEDQKAEARESIDAMKTLSEEYKKKHGGGSTKILWGLFGGGGGGGSEREKSEAMERFRRTMHEVAQTHRWEGKKTDPLKQKLYQVVKSDLDHHLKSTFDVEIIRAPNVTMTGAKIHTTYNTMDFDRQMLRQLQNVFPNTQLPTKGEPRRIR